jgi:D-sedoheptulose 7-phosphate isomerase
MARASQPSDQVRSAVADFLADLGRALKDVQVSTRSGQPLDFAEGMERVVDLIMTKTRAGRKLMFIGNGASAAIASHQSTDYWKTGRMRAVAFNDPALLTSVSNDFGYGQVFERPIEMFADPGDVLVAVSSSGQSQNILRGARKAREKGCSLLTLSGFAPDNPLRSEGDLNLYVPSASYGHVEITHLTLLHCLLDTIISLRGTEATEAGP